MVKVKKNPAYKVGDVLLPNDNSWAEQVVRLRITNIESDVYRFVCFFKGNYDFSKGDYLLPIDQIENSTRLDSKAARILYGN